MPRPGGWQCQDLHSLGSVDPLEGQRASPLEAPPRVHPAFVLHLVGEERCGAGKIGIQVRTSTPEPAIYSQRYTFFDLTSKQPKMPSIKCRLARFIRQLLSPHRCV